MLRLFKFILGTIEMDGVEKLAEIAWENDYPDFKWFSVGMYDFGFYGNASHDMVADMVSNTEHYKQFITIDDE